jgi:hypothetical protein
VGTETSRLNGPFEDELETEAENQLPYITDEWDKTNSRVDVNQGYHVNMNKKSVCSTRTPRMLLEEPFTAYLGFFSPSQPLDYAAGL